VDNEESIEAALANGAKIVMAKTVEVLVRDLKLESLSTFPKKVTLASLSTFPKKVTFKPCSRDPSPLTLNPDEDYHQTPSTSHTLSDRVAPQLSGKKRGRAFAKTNLGGIKRKLSMPLLCGKKRGLSMPLLSRGEKRGRDESEDVEIE